MSYSISSLLKILASFFLIASATTFAETPHLNPITSDLPPSMPESQNKETNEFVILDSLIAATQQSLESQKTLREWVKQFKEIQNQCLLNPEDSDLLLRAVKVARRTLECMKENHLTQAFDPEFISELSLFAQVASKRGIPKPQ